MTGSVGFLEQWPEAEFGPAHIVLSDCNVEDGHLTWCLGLTRAALTGDPAYLESAEDVSLMDSCDWHRNRELDELRATDGILCELLAIPRESR